MGKTAQRAGKKGAVKKVVRKRKTKKKKNAAVSKGRQAKSEECGADGLTAWQRAADAAMEGYQDPETKKRARVRALLTEGLIEWLEGQEINEDEDEDEDEEEDEDGPRAVMRQTVIDLEEALFAVCGAHGCGDGITQEYKEKAKSLKFNLKTNKDLRDALFDTSLKFNGQPLTARALLAMSSKDLARSDKKEVREEVGRAAARGFSQAAARHKVMTNPRRDFT